MLPDDLVPFPTFKTERLTLRQLLDNDAEAIFSLRSDLKINKYLDRKPCGSLDDALIFITKTNEHIKHSPLKYWAIKLKNSKDLIGTICLFDFDNNLKKCEIGYELLSSYQGKGIMNEATNAIIDYAFNSIGLKIIEACTHKDNHNSTKLLQKLNFTKIEVIDETSNDQLVFRLTKRL